MGTITRTYSPATSDTILAAHLNTDLDTIYSEFNGSIENANVAAAAAIAISKTALGTFTDWTAYNPTWAGTGNPAKGNGVITGRYSQIGNFVALHISFTAGGTTTFGTGNDWTFTLPVNSAQTLFMVGTADASDTTNSKRYIGTVYLNAATTLQIVNCGVTGATTTGVWGTTLPFTWVNTDNFRLNVFYEAA